MSRVVVFSEEKTLTIEVKYLQGEHDWERRVISAKVNGKDVTISQARIELLKTNQPLLKEPEN